MDKEKILKIIHNLEVMLDELKHEVYSNKEMDYEETYLPVEDYDEIFEEFDET